MFCSCLQKQNTISSARKDQRILLSVRRNEYHLHNVDRILNLMRMGDLTEENQQKRQSVDVMLCQAFNNLMNIRLNNPRDSIQSFLVKVNQLYPNKLLNENTNLLVVGLYSSTGMKKRLKSGKLKYDSATNSSQGHFILATLDLIEAKVTFIDSLNEKIHKSSFFDFPMVAQTFVDIYACIKLMKKEEASQLSFNQKLMKTQIASDCGLHLCANAELILKNLCPSKQNFRDENIKQIRQYHFLLCDETIKTFRLDLNCQ